MKIAICGTPTVGKTKFIDKFLENWNSYKLVKRSEDENNLMKPESRYDISKLDKILNYQVDNALFYEGKNDVISDGCLIDAMAHIMMFFAMHPEAKDDVMQKFLALFKTSISYYDIIFYISFNNQINKENNDVSMTEDEYSYLFGLDNIYREIFNLYQTGEESSLFPFNSKEGCPPIIELAGTTDERIKLTSLYINSDGSAYGKEDSLLTGFFS